jgi:hypothetical protein
VRCPTRVRDPDVHLVHRVHSQHLRLLLDQVLQRLDLHLFFAFHNHTTRHFDRTGVLHKLKFVF